MKVKLKKDVMIFESSIPFNYTHGKVYEAIYNYDLEGYVIVDDVGNRELIEDIEILFKEV